MLTRRDFLKTAAGVTAAGAFGVASAGWAQEKRQPLNVICILCDDMGAQELGCYGNTLHRTPRLDALAAGGTRLDTFYATPVCSPTRVCLMTGRYGFRTGWCNMRGRGAGSPPKDADLARDEENFGELARKIDCATGFAGKWQLTGDRLATMLSDAGFDESLMWIYLNYLDKGEEYRGGFETPGKDKASRYWHPGLARNGVHVETTGEDYGPDEFAGFCTDFIGRHKDKPFFFYYPMVLIHQPWLNTPDTKELTGRNGDAHLKANVEYADKVVGRIVDALEEHGLREKTVILFMGDNGTGTRGKSTPTEWGCRVPFIANCPGTVKEGIVSRELADISDILPTIIDFAGGTLPEDIPYDGRSLAPLLRGETDNHREWIFSCLGHYRILRDKRWLLEQNTPEDFGQFWDCGEARDGRGYKDVTDSEDAEAVAARERFKQILEKLPFPETTADDREDFRRFTQNHLAKLNAYIDKLDGVPKRKCDLAATRRGSRAERRNEDE
ncbi:MAG: sulfatase-like hydrolase/transferase [Candidatus Hydrogenedentes bacterium]|nr:sulfatase-like hydrolase/transferase [Candidatus Hydrogenedentota bacterium]